VTENRIEGGTFFGPVFQGRDFVIHLPETITPAMSGLPAAPASFSGRQDVLDELLGALAPRTAPGPATALVTAVSGMGGIGKTALAVQAAQLALDRGWFEGGVLFTDLAGYGPARRLSPGQALKGFLQALAIPPKRIPRAERDRVRLYTSALATYAAEGRRVLVVIDNASTHDQVRPLLPGDKINAAIVTSRDTLGLLEARIVDLAVLDEAESVELLARVLQVARPGDTRIAREPGAAREIAAHCGGLPLALRIVAAMLADDPARPVRAMAANLADERDRLAELAYADKAVRAAFDLSYRALDAEAARLFALLPVNPGPDLSTEAAARLADLGEGQARRALQRLARAHLIEPGADGRWRLHDLVRLFAQELPHEDRDAAFPRLLEFYASLTRAAGARVNARDADPDDRAAALGWLDAEYRNLAAAVDAAAGHPAHAVELAAAMALFIDWRRHSHDWITPLTTARVAVRALDDPHTEADVLTSLGLALVHADRFEEAGTVSLDAVRIYRETGDRAGEGGALSNAGMALMGAGRFEDAVDACREAAEIFHDSGDLHSEGKALGNLGLALSTTGRYEDALEAHRHNLRIYEDLGDLQGRGRALNNLGNALRDVGRLEDAVAAWEDSARICRETGDQHNESQALGNLAAALHGLERFEEAVDVYRRDLLVCRQTGNRFNEATTLNGLGTALLEVGGYAEAITVCREAGRIIRDLGDRRGEGQVLNRLGQTLIEVLCHEEAVVICADAAQIFRETGHRHEMAGALGNLAIALLETGDFEEAAHASREAAEAFRETGDREDEAIALRSLGSALLATEDYDEAILTCQAAAAACRDSGDRYSEGVALGNLGIALHRTGRLEEAVTAHTGSVQAFEDAGDEDDAARARGYLQAAMRAAQHGPSSH
jgi:tetratricopeptide (TPR) repeat protein